MPSGIPGAATRAKTRVSPIVCALAGEKNAVVVNATHPIQRAKNVHFTPEGYQELARSVAASVEAALGQ